MSPCVRCRLPYAATLMLQFLHYAARARCLNVRRMLDKAATDLTDQHLRAFENRCDYKLGCKRIRRTNAGAARGPSVGGRVRRIAQRLASIDGRPWPHDGIVAAVKALAIGQRNADHEPPATPLGKRIAEQVAPAPPTPPRCAALHRSRRNRDCCRTSNPSL